MVLAFRELAVSVTVFRRSGDWANKLSTKADNLLFDDGLIGGSGSYFDHIIHNVLSMSPNYHVLLGSRGLEEGESAALQIKNVGGSVEAIQLDVTDAQSITAARELVETKHGRLDVLTNVFYGKNAAILFDFQVNIDYTLGQAMQDTFATNTSGAANLVETFLSLLKLSAVPRVVFVSKHRGQPAHLLQTPNLPIP
ncbi:hypothetical protein E4T43_07582 [Aureobasidium subglaciale]|nr:hypothetical protein E4T43_07582 [Aureobasidium subglaciale]